MIWLYILRERLDVEGVDFKSVEMKNLNGNGITKENGVANGFLKDKSVIINETSNGEEDNFLSNRKSTSNGAL